jgi:hypothetical protein
VHPITADRWAVDDPNEIGGSILGATGNARSMASTGCRSPTM